MSGEWSLLIKLVNILYRYHIIIKIIYEKISLTFLITQSNLDPTPLKWTISLYRLKQVIKIVWLQDQPFSLLSTTVINYLTQTSLKSLILCLFFSQIKNLEELTSIAWNRNSVDTINKFVSDGEKTINSVSKGGEIQI